MKYAGIVCEHNDFLCSDIEYNDPVDDYIVYCSLDFYGYEDDNIDICDDKDKRVSLGNVNGYLILSHVMKQMKENAYTVCDDHSGDLETVMSILSNHNKMYVKEDIFYIEETTLKEDAFNDVMDRLPKILLTHYHAYPKIVCYYPAPLFETETPAAYKVKEDIGKLIARDIISQNIPVPDDESCSDELDFIGETDDEPCLDESVFIEGVDDEPCFDEFEFIEGIDDADIADEGEQPTVIVHLDEEQLNACLGRRNDYNNYPENAKNPKEFEKFNQAGFNEFGETRLLVRLY